MTGRIAAVHRNARHGFSKQPQRGIRLIEGCGVEGDAHCGETVQHLYLKRRNPEAPNRMQVHLLQLELFSQLAAAGHDVQPGNLGENITTSGIDLLTLPLGSRLQLGADAMVELTGLRSPCQKIETFQSGLLKQVVTKDADGDVKPLAGVMAIVIAGGEVMPGDLITVELPAAPHRSMTMI